MKYLVSVVLCGVLVSCSNDSSGTDNRVDTATANITVDSSATMNDSTKLPKDSLTTVAH